MTLIQRIAGTLRALQDGWWNFFNERCLAGFPWFWPARPPGLPSMVAARRMARRDFGRNHATFLRALAQALATVTWPVAVLVQLWQIRHFRGPKAVPIRRVPEALWVALRNNVQPGEYFAYGLWQPDRRINIDNYLYSREGPRLFKLLNRPAQPNFLDDKLAFHEMCRRHALPSPEILAAFAPSGKLLEFDFGRPPTHDLFIKPRIGAGGGGSERFRWRGRIFESELGGLLRAEDLSGYLASRAFSQKRTLLVQPALSNSPELYIAETSSLATARLVTGLTNNGYVIPIFGIFFYIDRTDQILARHALIDVATGQLTWEPGEFSRAERSNPGSINVRALPGWDMVLGYVKVAHQACSGFAFVGWDVAFTETGPILLEGNVNWSADDYQRLRGEPLGSTKFSEILAERLTVAKVKT